MFRRILRMSMATALFLGTSFSFIARVRSVASEEAEAGSDDPSSVASTVIESLEADRSIEHDATLEGSRGIPAPDADAKRERALRLIKRKGGRVTFESELDRLAMEGKKPSLEQLFEMVRNDSAVKVRRVTLSQADLDEDDLRILVAGLPEVDSLSLAGKGISEAGLAIISELAELTSLGLDGLEITGEGLAHLQALPNLRYLYLDEAHVDDDDLIPLRGLKSLERLTFRRSTITDEGLAQLTQLKWLKELYLNGTAITPEGLRFLKELPMLEVLQLDESVLSADGQRHLSECRRLEKLILPPYADENQVADWSDLDQLRARLDNEIRDALYEGVMRVNIERRR